MKRAMCIVISGLLLAGCKKENTLNESSQSFIVSNTSWIWSANNNNYYYDIADSRITQSVMDNGLMIAYFEGQNASRGEYLEALPHYYPNGIGYIDFFNVGIDEMQVFGIAPPATPQTLTFVVVVVKN